MKTRNDLHVALSKYGFFYDPLFETDYGTDINTKYAHEYSEQTDLLYLNSKVKNGKNYYREFTKSDYKNFFEPSVYKTYKEFLSPIIEVSSDKNGRYFGFSTKLPMIILAKKHNISFDSEEPDFKNIYSQLKNKLPEKIRICEDIVKKGNNSIYYDNAFQKLELVNASQSIDIQELRRPFITATLFMQLGNEYKKDYSLFNSLDKIAKTKFNDDKFFECYDTDKFLLLFSKIVMDKANLLYKDFPDVINLVPQVYQYIHFVEELGLKDYNPKITIVKENKRKIKMMPYTFNDLTKEVNKFLEEHKDYSFKYVSVYDPVFDFNESNVPSKEAIEKEAIKYRYGESYQNITASWEFIKKGETDRIISSHRIINSNDRKTREPIDIDYRLSVFNKTDYICQIQGTGKFKGYIGFIYPNGLIAFESFFDEKGKVSKDNNATYIMNINNFEKFSSLTKPEIMGYIKDMGNEEIDRKYHSLNWEKNLRKIVENPNCEEEMKEKVKAVIAEGRKAKKLEY